MSADHLLHFHSTHLQDLIETTAQIHYEAFRSKQLLAYVPFATRPTRDSADNCSSYSLKESSASKQQQHQQLPPNGA